MRKKLFIISKDFKIEEKNYSNFKDNSKNFSFKDLNALDYANIGWYIIIPILIFLTIGIFVKRLLGSGVWVAVFLFLGIASGFYNVFKLIRWKK